MTPVDRISLLRAPGGEESLSQEVLRDYRVALQRSAGLSAAEAEALAGDRQAGPHRSYLCLVDGLSESFAQADPVSVSRLAVAAYGTYRMLLEVDTLVDESDSTVLPVLLQHQQVVMDALDAVFGRNDARREWQARWLAQWHAIRSELTIAPDAVRAADQYRQLAAEKSGMVRLAVDWLGRLSPQAERVELLRKSLTAMHVGMQWIDDIRDFEDDCLRGQRTWARDVLAVVLDKNGIPRGGVSPAMARRILFASGAAEALVRDAQHELRTAREHADQAGCSWLVSTVDAMGVRATEFADAIAVQRSGAELRVSVAGGHSAMSS